MDALPIELRRELIKRVFPDLRYGGDPDIERYFECRKAGKMGEALGIYNGPLRTRYPEDKSRILLLKLYREGDPRWRELQDRLILELASGIATSMARNIDVLLAPIGKTELSNAFKALNAVEAVLRIVPAKGDEALAFLDRYESLARLLSYREGEMERAQSLVREYLAMAKADSPAEYDFIARSEAIEERRREAEARRRASEGQRRNVRENYDFIAASQALEARKKKEAESRSRFFDLSRIEFSAVERARIEISPSIVRREDRVLAFCWKYWELVTDPGFERLVFLYSRKYGTRHFEIFQTIKLGRLRHFTDDEVLTAVSTLLSSSYSYSVSGDLYMQAMWRRLKARAEAERAAAIEAAAEKALAEKGRRGSPAASRETAPRATPHAEPRPAPHDALRPAPRETPRSATVAETKRAAAPPEPAASRAIAALRASPATPALRATPPIVREPNDRPAAPSPERKNPAREAPRPREQLLATRPRPEAPRAVPELSNRSGSISERIRKLSGKAYDVYKQLFITRVRDDIHRNLLANRQKAFKLFDDSANEAEDIIFAFMSDHYADPYMNWEESEERKKVEGLGYAVASLDPIIEAWFRRL